MKNKCKILILKGVLISQILISCSTFGFINEKIDVNGMIYDYSNRPVNNCEISLGEKLRGFSDINGRFNIAKVPVGNYVLEGYKAGFENCIEEISIKENGQIIYIKMPSQKQLLKIVDEALAANNLEIAWEMAERAYQVDNNNIEALFYCATVKFRQSDYKRAIDFLLDAENIGTKDVYTAKFLKELKELQNAKGIMQVD